MNAAAFSCLDNHDIISVKVYDIDAEDDATNEDKKEVIWLRWYSSITSTSCSGC